MKPEDYISTKLCPDCDERQPIENFRHRIRTMPNERKRIEVNKRCRPCESYFNSQKGKAYRAKQKPECSRPTGPTGIERMFFCELPCTLLAVELRAGRVG